MEFSTATKKLQVFLHCHQVFVACVQETKLNVNSSLKEITDYATINSDRTTGGGGGFVTLVHHSVPYRVPDGNILPKDDMVGIPSCWGGPRGQSCLLLLLMTPPRRLSHGITPSISTLSWRAAETRWCSATSTPTSYGSPGQEMIGQRPEEKRLMERSIVHSLRLRTLISILAFPPRASPPCQISPSWVVISSLTWSTFTTLGSDHLPITISLSSHTPASPQKVHSYTNFCKADRLGEIHSRVREEICRDSTANLLLFWRNSFPAYSQRRRRTHIPRG